MSEFLTGLHAEPIDDEFVAGDKPFRYEPEPPVDDPDPVPSDFVQEKKRSPRAKKFERKMAGTINAAIRATAPNPSLSADSAALVMYGPDLARAVGDVCDANPKLARAVEFLTEGTESPYLALTAAAMPLILQLIRNHEPVAEPVARGVHIPFTNRTIKMRFRVRLGRLEAATNSPRAMWDRVFTDSRVVSALEKQGVTIAPPLDAE